MFAILGSGFGLYGYLPALIELGERVALPERYRDRFAARQELASFAPHIRWMANEADALAHADGVVLAMRPADQCEWISRCLAHGQIERLILEKPLAPAPGSAAAMLESLGRSGRTFRIGYTFRHTDWAQRLQSLVRTKGVRSVTIHWNFMAHHFRHGLRNWKRSSEQGGGAIRFYGIQAIALLAEFGYRDVAASTGYGSGIDEIEHWVATFTGRNLPACHVAINSRAANAEFRIDVGPENGPECHLVEQQNPFDSSNGESIQKGLDRRVDILTQLGRSLWQSEPGGYDWYGAAITLWRATESKLQYNLASEE